MDKSKLNISKIEGVLSDIIGTRLSKNVFLTALPDNIEETWEDIVVIDLSTEIQDKGAYGSGNVNIIMYAKPFADGQKKISAMSKMEAELNNIIAENKSGCYRLVRRSNYTDYDSTRNLHMNVWILNLLIY